MSGIAPALINACSSSFVSTDDMVVFDFSAAGGGGGGGGPAAGGGGGGGFVQWCQRGSAKGCKTIRAYNYISGLYAL